MTLDLLTKCIVLPEAHNRVAISANGPNWATVSVYFTPAGDTPSSGDFTNAAEAAYVAQCIVRIPRMLSLLNEVYTYMDGGEINREIDVVVDDISTLIGELEPYNPRNSY